VSIPSDAATLAGWQARSFTAGGITHVSYRKGRGPGVVVVHEIPGITPSVMTFAEEVVAAGYTVEMPLLVGEVGREPSGTYMAASMAKVCVSREFTTWATGRTSPVVSWLRALGQRLHADVGGPGIGAIGMCFSGGFALGMMLDDAMVAPVLSQPSLPFAFGGHRRADIGLSPDDLDRVVQRAADGCQVLGLRYAGDRLVGSRFDTLTELLGEAFIAVEFPSRRASDHSVLTEQRRDAGVAAVLAFLADKLHPVGT
jgi:dienelactone hydrolase